MSDVKKSLITKTNGQQEDFNLKKNISNNKIGFYK